MKEVIKKLYVASDKTEFDKESDCRKYEKALEDIKNIFAQLSPRPSDMSFANGNGYIQHSKQAFKKAERAFYEAACKYHRGLDEYKMNSYAFWRSLDDNDSPFYCNHSGGRLLCTSKKTWREYGQPYYAEHEDEAKQIQLNA